MIKRDDRGLRYYQFETLKESGIFHGIFTRLGGRSPKPWDSLNIGGTVGDQKTNVASNLDRLLKTVGVPRDHLAQVHQIHSTKTLIVHEPQEVKVKADAMISAKQNIFLLMRFADCVPLLFADRAKRVVGIAHAGWQGTVKLIAQEVVERMHLDFKCDPADIIVGIGPSIGPDHYFIRDDVIQEVKRSFPDHWQELISPTADGVKLDLWKANDLTLRAAGIRSIEHSYMCTGCNTNEWYSHRAEFGKTGRFAALIGLKP
jgi:YfiH family protein